MLRSITDKRLGRLPRRLARQAGGNAALEMALIAPVLVLLLVGIADFGMAVYRKMQVQHAAQAGAEYAMVHGFSSSAITSTVTAATAFTGITASPAPAQSCGCVSGTTVAAATCGTNCASGTAAGTYVTVSAQGSYATIIPYPGIPSSFTLTAASVVRIQ
jgi:Flp pilus assembly protein TadG